MYDKWLFTLPSLVPTGLHRLDYHLLPVLYIRITSPLPSDIAISVIISVIIRCKSRLEVFILHR